VFEKLITEIGGALDGGGVPYMIIGGQAVLLYGSPRLTRDIDITLGADVSRLDEILSIIDSLGLKVIPKDIETFVKQTMVVPAIEESSGIRVDFIFSFTPYEAEAIKRARKVVINLREVRFASPEDLIIHKIFAGRAIDLEDVKVIVLKVNNLDIQYIVRWLREFDSSFEGSNFLESFNIILDNISSK